MHSRVRFFLPSSNVRPAHFDYAFEPVFTRSYVSSPSSSFDSTLETLHEDSELEVHHSSDRMDDNSEESFIPHIHRSSSRKPFSNTLNRIDEEEDNKAKD